MENWIFLCVVAILATGCASSGGKVKQPPMPNNAVKSYKIGVGDSLSVQVWKSPELSMVVPVRPDGQISIPLIGDVIALGQTPMALASTLKTKLGEFVRNAQVTVVVTNAVSGQYLRRVRVTGAVNNPVSRPYSQGMTVLDLVLEAGGPNLFAKPNKAILYRNIEGKINLYPIYLGDILKKGKLDTNYLLAPTDIITVPERSL